MSNVEGPPAPGPKHPILDAEGRTVSSIKAKSTDIQLAPAVPMHKGQVKTLTGVPMYPGGPTTNYAAFCDEGCKWNGPVRQVPHLAEGDLLAHMTGSGKEG